VSRHSTKGEIVSIDAFDAFWIQRGSRSLYAALHRPRTDGADVGVLCVPPLLHEQPRSRRFIAEAANALAAVGVPALRFDFHGSGDSTGQGDALDFSSVRLDLDSAVTALRDVTGVARVVAIAWRAGALVLADAVEHGLRIDRAVLWEPILDGAAWRQELERDDASERTRRPRPRPGVPRTSDPADGQLMGFAASTRLRDELARADATRLSSRIPVWTVERDGADAAPGPQRRWALPAGAPTFAGGAQMEATLFLAPRLEALVREIGDAVRDDARVAA
jgi:alpha-beta hydrolase superfamily lysophospholipase